MLWKVKQKPNFPVLVGKKHFLKADNIWVLQFSQKLEKERFMNKSYLNHQVLSGLAHEITSWGVFKKKTRPKYLRLF